MVHPRCRVARFTASTTQRSECSSERCSGHQCRPAGSSSSTLAPQKHCRGCISSVPLATNPTPLPAGCCGTSGSSRPTRSATKASRSRSSSLTTLLLPMPAFGRSHSRSTNTTALTSPLRAVARRGAFIRTGSRTSPAGASTIHGMESSPRRCELTPKASTRRSPQRPGSSRTDSARPGSIRRISSRRRRWPPTPTDGTQFTRRSNSRTTSATGLPN